MRIRSVTAHAFGPLAGSTLEFADAMTVVHGPNESAKSSWHAAIYAALCGRRRGRGRPTPDEQDFAARHRPWDRSDWLVAARLVLDDGRRVELRQDLAGLVACDAVDLDLGRDCSAEIMHDDTPDAARWLGLDRNSFRATAFVAQAQVLDVLRRAGGLQNELQRAAATAGTDETAAAALRRLDQFQSEHVGTERAPTKPLRRATDAVRLATTTLTQAQADHAEYERRLLALAGLRAESDAAEQAVRDQVALLARREARQARTLAESATAVAARVDGTTPPPVPPPALVQLVAAALAGHTADAGSPSPALVGAAAVRGDPAVRGEAGGRNDAAVRGGRGAVAIPVSEADLYEWAGLLDEAPPAADPTLPAALQQAEAAAARLVQTRRQRRRIGAIMPVLAVVGVLSWLFAGDSVPLKMFGALLIVAGVLTTVAAWVAAGRVARPDGAAVAAIRARLADERRAIADATGRHSLAVARVSAAGLAADPASLRQLARRQVEEQVVRQRDQQWQHRSEQAAEERLLAAATEVGRPASTPAEAATVLQQWQRDQAAAIAVRERGARDAAELAGLLRGHSLADIQQRAVAAEERARHLTAVATPAGEASTVDDSAAGAAQSGEIDQIDDEAMAEVLDRRRDEARSAGQAVHSAEASVQQWLGGVTAVGEAEEDLARAEADLAAVRELDETLSLTRRFLGQAEETAHRTIAPRLAAAVSAWLPRTTAGRYTEVMVDPEQLRVQVRGPAGRWRDAGQLSYGTAEQIYLMLRIALAEHLTRAGTVCPLLLDDVTVHADAARTERLLELLLRASDDRQVILFTQEDRVVEWARRRLTGPDHAVVELAEVAGA